MINKLRYEFEVNTAHISELQNKEILTKMCWCEWHGANVPRNL